jgi:hypothetical protein
MRIHYALLALKIPLMAKVKLMVMKLVMDVAAATDRPSRN